jgi:hypothetical protein
MLMSTSAHLQTIPAQLWIPTKLHSGGMRHLLHSTWHSMQDIEDSPLVQGVDSLSRSV